MEETFYHFELDMPTCLVHDSAKGSGGSTIKRKSGINWTGAGIGEQKVEE